VSALHLIVVFVVSLAAGSVNAIAGGGTLLSFPTLVFLGVGPIAANATNALGLWPGSFAGLLGFRRDMAGARRWAVQLIWPSLAGGVLGAFLLLRTPADVFSAISPVLVLLATFLLAIQDRLARWIGLPADDGSTTRRWAAGAVAGQFAVAVYGGFFGAGIGILMLATLGLLGLTDIHQMNGLKNLFAICINGVAAVYFAISGAVVWSDAGIMAAGAILGGFGGAGLAHRLGRTFVRRVVIGIGISSAAALTIRLFV
jgi:uncharacterized membrane protein YfcA